jgi:hypothetical protein
MNFLACTYRPPQQLLDTAGTEVNYVPGRMAKAVLSQMPPGFKDMIQWQGGPKLFLALSPLQDYFPGFPDWAMGTVMIPQGIKGVAVVLEHDSLVSSTQERGLVLHEAGHKISWLYFLRYGRYVSAHPKWLDCYARFGANVVNVNDGKKLFPNAEEYWASMSAAHMDGFSWTMQDPVRDFCDRAILGRSLD